MGKALVNNRHTAVGSFFDDRLLLLEKPESCSGRIEVGILESPEIICRIGSKSYF